MNGDLMKNKRIFITGGAGYLGKHLVKRYYTDNEITIFSRDEAKHYYLKKQYPKINCVIGDVRNYELMKQASKNHNIGIFAASLKQISAVDQNVEEAIQVLIHGAINSRKICIENDFESGCFISSDKSRAATTLYGSMKFIAGESFIINSESVKPNLSTVIYGNVMNSTGSIIPLIWDAINKDYKLTLYDLEMTRFMIDIDQAIDLIELALNNDGYNLIPKLNSFRVYHLFQIYEKFGLKWKKGVPRVSEKIHETLITKEELPRTVYNFGHNVFFMHYKNLRKKALKTELISSDCVISISELEDYLKKNNYFKPGK